MRLVRLSIVIAAAVALAAIAVAADAKDEPGVDNPVLLKVNGTDIYAAEINLIMQNLAAEIQRRGAPVEEQKLFEAALSQAVDTRLLAQEAKSKELKVNEERVTAALEAAYRAGGGREALVRTLQTIGLSIGAFEAKVREAELVQQFVERYIEPKIALKDSEVEEFYEANKERMKRPEQVRARHILIGVEKDADAQTKAAARAEAEAARERAVAGEDFALLAKELSDCSSAARGGDLGFFSADRMVPSFSKAAFALKPGAVSEVVETVYGYHVIRLEERRAAGTQTLDEASGSIRNLLKRQKVAAAVEMLLETLRAEAKVVAMRDVAGDAAAGSGATTSSGGSGGGR